ncbi:MAG: hypothetical protein LEGION0403_FIIPPAGN_02189 [Legionella sp.]|uniref:hypothetical protein n=1 Tax=Legionella sp. TaxID=459 RepID=UPI003D0AADD5
MCSPRADRRKTGHRILYALLYFTVMLLSADVAHQSLIKTFYLEIYSSNLLSDLKRSEANFRNTIENALFGMAIVSPEGECLHANPLT